MTENERLQKIEALKGQLLEYRNTYNDQINAKTRDLDEIEKTMAKIDEAIGDHNLLARIQCFEECVATGNPMLEAVTRMTYQSLDAKYSDGNDDEPAACEIVPKDTPIDLLKLQKHAGKNIGASTDWYDRIQRFNFLMTQKVMADVGKKVPPKSLSEQYMMSEMAKKIEMGGDPTSKTARLKALQAVVTAMLGDGYRAISYNVGYIDNTFAKKGKDRQSISTSNHKTLMNLIVDVCNQIVTQHVYSVIYRTAKQKEPQSSPVEIVKPAKESAKEEAVA